jgi:hypothetical protein
METSQYSQLSNQVPLKYESEVLQLSLPEWV